MAKVKNETLIYWSYTTNSFSQIFDGSYTKQKRVKHKVKLWMPQQAKTRVPVIIMQHGTAPPNKYKKWLNISLPIYLSEGFAVVMNDSYRARKLKRPKQLSFSARVIDNIMLFNRLFEDKRFDPDNINIQGFSYGGMVAYHMAYEAYQPLLAGTWNSHLSMYGACDVILEDSEMTGAPVLMYLAGRENRQSNNDCFKYREQVGGFDIVVLENAYHGFALDDGVTHDSNTGVFTRCDTGPQNTISKGGVWKYNKTHWSGSYNDIISGIWKVCGTYEKTVFGGSEATKIQAVKDSILFFKRNNAQ